MFDIRPTESDGAPTRDDSSILAQVVIPRSDFVIDPNQGLSDPPPIGPLQISVDLSIFNLFFEVDDLLAINFSATENSGPGPNFAIMGDFNGSPFRPYETGQAFLRRDDAFVGDYHQWSAPNSPEIGGIDLGFRTYVSPCSEFPGGGASVVPVPAAAWLFGTAMLGLVGFSRRKVASLITEVYIMLVMII